MVVTMIIITTMIIMMSITTTPMMVTLSMTTPLMTPVLPVTCLSSAGRPQPDNRESGSDEACMAVLNDFYGDGEAGDDNDDNDGVVDDNEACVAELNDLYGDGERSCVFKLKLFLPKTHSAA